VYGFIVTLIVSDVFKMSLNMYSVGSWLVNTCISNFHS